MTWLAAGKRVTGSLWGHADALKLDTLLPAQLCKFTETTEFILKTGEFCVCRLYLDKAVKNTTGQMLALGSFPPCFTTCFRTLYNSLMASEAFSLCKHPEEASTPPSMPHLQLHTCFSLSATCMLSSPPVAPSYTCPLHPGQI